MAEQLAVTFAQERRHFRLETGVIPFDLKRIRNEATSRVNVDGRALRKRRRVIRKVVQLRRRNSTSHPHSRRQSICFDRHIDCASKSKERIPAALRTHQNLKGR